MPVRAGNRQSPAILPVTDTRKGIAAQVRKHLIDTFFTTKEGGSGLGLAIAAPMVETQRGLLRYKTDFIAHRVRNRVAQNGRQCSPEYCSLKMSGHRLAVAEGAEG